MSLKAAWFQTLNLKCDILVSKFAFKWVNLYRYDKAAAEARFERDVAGGGCVYKLTLDSALDP